MLTQVVMWSLMEQNGASDDGSGGQIKVIELNSRHLFVQPFSLLR